MATALLDRARLTMLAQREASLGITADWLCCAVCITMHPSTCFSTKQRSSTSLARACLAAEASFNVCPHWKLDLRDLRATKRAKIHTLCNDRTKAQPCACIYGKQDDFTMSKCVLWCGSVLTNLNQQYELREHRDVSPIVSALTACTRSLCEHLKVNDIRIVQSFQVHAVATSNDTGLHGSGRCHLCSMTWKFEHKQIHNRPSPTFRLCVDRYLGTQQTAWTPERLAMVEGGDKFLGIAPGCIGR